MSYKDFDEKIENEIISLSHLTENKYIDELNYFYERDDDKREEDKKKFE